MATEELRIIISAEDKASPATNALTANLGGLGKLASGALKVGLAAAATGVVALGAGLFSSVEAAVGAQNVLMDLDATLASTGAAAARVVDGVVSVSAEAGKAIKSAADEHADGISKVSEKAAEEAASLTAKIEDLESSHADKLASVVQSMAETTSAFNDKQVENERQTTEKLGDLAQGHADKLSSIAQSTAEATRAFNDGRVENERQTTEKLGDLAQGHADKLSSLEGRVSDLKSSFNDSEQDRKDTLADTLEAIEERAADKRSAIEKKLAAAKTDADRKVLRDELAVLDAETAEEEKRAGGKAAKEEARAKKGYEKKKADLAAALVKENEEYAKQETAMKEAANRETATQKAAYDLRLSHLVEAKTNENAEYVKQGARIKEAANRETTTQKAAYDLRLSHLVEATAKENKEYEKQTEKITAERAKIETVTKDSLAKVDRDYADSVAKLNEKFSALELGLVPLRKVEQVSRETLIALAEGFQKLTPFEDDVTLKGEAMLLTFTNIGKDVFPLATEAMLNMGQKFGSVDAAALQLGKALNDPIAGVGALRRVGVQLTDAQEQSVKDFMAVNNIAGAQKIILGELQTEFGGLAVAAGQTASGRLEIFKNKLGDIEEKIGGAMLPGLTKLGDGLIKALDNPIVVKAIDTITNWLAEALPKAIDAGAGLLDTLSTKGIGGVLANIQAWVNDPATQKALQTAGAQLGQGAFAGIKAALTSGPMWAQLASDIGKIILPLALEMGTSFWIGMIGGMMGKTPEEISKGIGISIPGIGGIGLGGAKVPGYAAGGVVGGPLGAPQLVVAHGGETISPAGGGSGGGNLVFVYSPMLSLADEREARTRLTPVLDQWWASAKRTRTA